MSDVNAIPSWAAMAFSFLSAVGGVVLAAWRGRGYVAEVEKEHDDKLDKLREDVRDDQDSLTRTYGEGLSALRQKVQEVEMYVRDEFVRREDFFEAMKTINRSIENLSSELRVSMKEVSAKMERILVSNKFSDGGK